MKIYVDYTLRRLHCRSDITAVIRIFRRVNTVREFLIYWNAFNEVSFKFYFFSRFSYSIQVRFQNFWCYKYSSQGYKKKTLKSIPHVLYIIHKAQKKNRLNYHILFLSNHGFATNQPNIQIIDSGVNINDK